MDADGADDLVGTDDDDVRLLAGSPCIDNADSIAFGPPVDLDGNARAIDDPATPNTGIGAVDGRPQAGRQAVTGEEADLGAFKVPTLRGLTETAPYMHDGSIATLEEVIEFYRAGGIPNSNLDPIIQPLELNDEEAGHLLAFLRSLSKRNTEAGKAGR